MRYTSEDQLNRVKAQSLAEADKRNKAKAIATAELERQKILARQADEKRIQEQNVLYVTSDKVMRDSRKARKELDEATARVEKNLRELISGNDELEAKMDKSETAHAEFSFLLLKCGIIRGPTYRNCQPLRARHVSEPVILRSDIVSRPSSAHRLFSKSVMRATACSRGKQMCEPSAFAVVKK